MKKTRFHFFGTDPNGQYMDHAFTDSLKLFQTIVPWMLDKELEEIQITSLSLAVRCHFTTKEFQDEFNQARRLGTLTEEMKLKKHRLDSRVNKALGILKNKLRLINTRQVHMKDFNGSKRFISLNESEVNRLVSTMNRDVREYEIEGKLYNIKKHRGLLIVIRKFIRYRIVTLESAIKKYKDKWSKYINAQRRAKKTRDLVSVIENNQDVIKLVEIEYKRKLSSKERFIISRWRYDYEDIKSALLKTLQLKKCRVEYMNKILESRHQVITKNPEQFDRFATQF
ncbi:hypothetical protein KHQ82_07325 [Mycoplasmatota bacterium]|nr:hypothetical protein KHQ82_07325 [Mycoplasmatota bacterium]